MALLAPPPSPPPVALCENDGLRRPRLRLWQLNASALNVVLTAWCCTLGAFPAIVALIVAKDVLLAILLMGLDVEAPVTALQCGHGGTSKRIGWENVSTSTPMRPSAGIPALAGPWEE
jgi:hypothetical protein